MANKTYLIDDTPGSLSDIYEVKILICHILKEAKKSITQELLKKTFLACNTVNYFNFCSAITELISTKHVKETVDKKLYVTNLGAETAALFKKNLPQSVITKTMKTLTNLLDQERQNKNRIVSTKKQDDGYTVKFVLEETGSNLIDLELYCPTKSEAIKFQQELKNKTTDLYKAILAILNDDSKILYEIARKIEKSKN